MDVAKKIRAQMKAKGLRVTPQRFSVYANLLSRQDHPTVAQILLAVNRELPIASKASIYGALTVLRKVNLVREVLLEEGVARYDANVNPHHHFICDRCGTIHDIPWETFAQFDLSVLGDRFDTSSYEVTVKGQCDRCRH